MRRSIDGLMAIVRDSFELDPYNNSLFLFYGKRCDRLKALHFDKDGFVLLYKLSIPGQNGSSANIRYILVFKYHFCTQKFFAASTIHSAFHHLKVSAT